MLAWRRWIALMLLPLAVLGLDFIFFPRVLEAHKVIETLAVNGLVEQRLIELGTVSATGLHTSLESMTDTGSLGYLARRQPSGLVISIFAEDGVVYEGQLARTVRQRLLTISAVAHQRVSDFF
jgi:hypothetical protein